MADRVTDSTASIRRGLNQHGCERIVLPSHIRVQSTKLTDISFVAYTDGLCPLCMVYQMAKEFATRRYQLTINNPKEHGYDHDTIKAILAKGAKLLYWCMCDEEGKEETYHTHLYLVFYNAVMFKTLKNKFPTAHIEVPQWGTNSENYAYIRKEGTKYHKDANGHYEYTDAQGKVHVGTNFSDTFEESGDLPPDAKQGDRNDLRMLYKLIASGEDNAQILGEHSDTKIVLGINAAGIPVCIDFGQLPHWLLAAATGMGKTQLVLLILHQLTQKGYVIYLADYKGVDFGSEYRKPGHYADNDADLEQMLDSVVRELNRRRTEFSIAGCANLEEYVRTTGDDLHRIVVILDETSMILDTTGRDKEGKAAISVITNKLLAIGRLGRALGIHLLVATQRPDVGSVPGSLKAQLDGRICGHTADAQSSIVILDDGSAANLPAIPGRFIIRNGSETDDIVQAYYYHK